MGILVETIATLISISSRIAAIRVSKPTIRSAPQTISTPSNERAHGVRRRNANLRKTARAEVGRIKKLLDPFCQNIPPTTIRTKIAQLELGSRAGGACSDSRSELREVVN